MKWPVLLVLALGCVLGTLLAAEETKKFSYVDLQPKANKQLTEKLGNAEGGNLAGLPKGEQTLEGVKFQIGDGLLQLGSKLLEKPQPDRVDGIQVGKAFAKLHLLHATLWGRNADVADDTEIARYEVHYDGGDTATIPIVYGKDVRDWWVGEDDADVTRGKVVWTGKNEATDRTRLYLSTWENPQPTKRVVSIDYVKVGDTGCAPFCVAMTLEEK